MDHLQTRLEALEQQMCTRHRELRWWRGLAASLVGLCLIGWALQASAAANTQSGALADRLAALQKEVAALRAKLVHLTSTTDKEGRPEVRITGANLRLVNGLGSTDCTDEEGNEMPDYPNGLGNLLVGYNEPRASVLGRTSAPARTMWWWGSGNAASGDEAVVSGGNGNTASGILAAVSGERKRTAEGEFDWVAGSLFAEE